MGEKSKSLVSIPSTALQKHPWRKLQWDKFWNPQSRCHKIEITYAMENSIILHVILMYHSVMW